MFYNRIKRNAEGRRIVGRLLALQNQLMAEGPPPKKRNTMLMATWNIREFDSPAYGDRQEEAYYYIAEIMSHFDLIAVQEVRENLEALYEVIKILGDGWWDFIVTDVTEGKPGNRERMAFVYDKRKVKFGGVAGEVVIPPKASRAGGQKTVYTPSDQLVRTPFLCGFRAGWAKFMLCTVHVLYGKSTKDDPRRVKEIELIAQFLAKRAGEDSTWSENIILLGDFNIFSPQDVTMKAILDAGFVIPEALREVPASNVGKRKRNYDQIAVLPKRFRLEPTGNAGVFDFYKSVFRDEDEATYVEAMGGSYLKSSKGNVRDEGGKRLYYRTYWRTYQMSDHLPMWIELQTDFGREYLQARL